MTLNGRRSDSTTTLEDWAGDYPSGPIKGTITNTCIKDNGWGADSNCQAPRSVTQTSYTLFTITNVANYFHASDDLYWWKYTRKFYIRDHPNPATADGVWYGPGGSTGFVASSNFNCDGGFPPTEVCRFN